MCARKVMPRPRRKRAFKWKHKPRRFTPISSCFSFLRGVGASRTLQRTQARHPKEYVTYLVWASIQLLYICSWDDF